MSENTCLKCLRPMNEGNSPNAEECHETDGEDGLCEAYAKVAKLEILLRECDLVLSMVPAHEVSQPRYLTILQSDFIAPLIKKLRGQKP